MQSLAHVEVSAQTDVYTVYTVYMYICYYCIYMHAQQADVQLYEGLLPKTCMHDGGGWRQCPQGCAAVLGDGAVSCLFAHVQQQSRPVLSW